MQMDQESLPHEEWRPVPDWPMYEVSNMGRVRRLSGRTYNGNYWSGRVLSPSKKEPKVMLCDGPDRSKSEKVSRLVLLAFRGPPPEGYECCHEDDDKTNNKLSNLRWDTHKANAADALRNNLMHIGERSPKAKLTVDQVQQIRKEYVPRKPGEFVGYHTGKSYGSIRQLAKKYNVHHSQIFQILSGKAWSHVK